MATSARTLTAETAELLAVGRVTVGRRPTARKVHKRGALALVLACGVVTTFGPSATVHVGHEHSAGGPAQAIPAPAVAFMSQTIGRDDRRYWARRTGTRLRARNAGHELSADFTAAGVTLRHAGGHLGVRLTAVGDGKKLTPLARVVPRAHANRVEFDHGPVREWYVNGPAGLEQGFSVDRLTGARPTGQLTLELSLPDAESIHVDPSRRSAAFGMPGGRGSVRYRGLYAADARGRQLPARLAFHEGHLRLRVDVRNATYPIHVDPIFSAATLSPSNPLSTGEGFSSVAVDGDTIVAGASQADAQQGAAYVFVRPPGGWINATQVAKLSPPAGDKYRGMGVAVAISGDTIVATEYDPDARDTGELRVFAKPPGGWHDLSQSKQLLPSDFVMDDGWGRELALSSDTLVVGAPAPNYGDPQVAYVYARSPDGWTNGVETARLKASDNAPFDGFGTSVAVRGDTIAIGAPQGGYYPPEGTRKGAVYVYRRPPLGWATATETVKLTASDGAVGDGLGMSVGLTDDSVIAGASNDEVNGQAGQGSAYVFARPTSAPPRTSEVAKLTASDGTPNALFGLTLSVADDNRVYVGSWVGTGGAGGDQGALYAFEQPPTGWLNSDESAKVDLPAATAVSGETLVATLPDLDSGIRSAQVFVDDSLPPSPPVLTATTPGSPARSTTLRVLGSSEPSSVVRLYDTSDCAGPPVVQGSAAAFASPGFSVTVPDNRLSLFRATATDRAGNVSPCSSTIAYVADSDPPDTSILSGPETAIDESAPLFVFSSDDADASFECQIDGGGFAPCPARFDTPALPDGLHVLRVRAVDRAGNADPTPVTRNLTIDTSAPQARLVATPNPVLTGQTVGFDASRSAEPPEVPIARYEWDLDGDGSFETDTGAMPRVSRTYDAAGDIAPAVQVTDIFGRTTTGEVPLSVRPTPPRGRIGVTIEDGALFTNSQIVQLSVVWPAGAHSMVLSNDGGFRNARAIPVSRQATWRLAAARPERQQNLVYVRFDSDPTPYSDNIILDEIAPRINAASLGRTGGSTVLHLRARDNRSGLQAAQIRYDRQRTRTVPYRARLRLIGRPSSVEVRVQDGAGNYSRWRTAAAQARYNRQAGR